METAALLNKVNDFARENNCKCMLVVFEKGHKDDLSAKLFRMLTENGARIIRNPINTKKRTPDAKGDAAEVVMPFVGKDKKIAAIKSHTASARSKAKESEKLIPAEKDFPANRKSEEWKQNAVGLLNVLQYRLAGLQAAE